MISKGKIINDKKEYGSTSISIENLNKIKIIREQMKIHFNNKYIRNDKVISFLLLIYDKLKEPEKILNKIKLSKL